MAYLAMTGVVATALFVTVTDQARRILREQTEGGLDAEIAALDAIYRNSGVAGLVHGVEARVQIRAASIYLLTTPIGEPIAGNVAGVGPTALDPSRRGIITYTKPDGTPSEALARSFILAGGVRLLVGRDLEEERRFHDVVLRASTIAASIVLIFGFGGGWFVASRVARRIEAMSATSRSIMAGDFTRRLPLAGSGDEFDRLASDVNAMLARIEALMHGLKEISDNIAHDLKTPLTRLRAHVEGALQSGANPAGMRAALERALEETENLIRTFDALLMIARTESGAGKEGFVDVDLNEIAVGVVDLYAALAEEKGVVLELQAPAPIFIRASRELLARAIANLVDNAIKHAGAGRVKVSVGEEPGGVLISVTDQGPGIPANERGRVLERFVRLEASRSHPGAGLGLSLVAAIARLHGGGILLEAADPGLKAVIRLPKEHNAH